MDEDVRVFRYRSATNTYTAEFTIDDPLGPFDAWKHVAGAFAGARATGFQADGDAPEEIGIVRGPASHDATTPSGQPPSFRGSLVRAFNVDIGGPTWSYDSVPLWSTLVFPEDETNGQPSTRGLQIARLKSTADLQGQYSFGPERGLLALGSAGAGPEPPVDPSRNAMEMAEEDVATFTGAAPGLFEDAASKAALLGTLGAIRDDMARGATGDARTRAVDLAAWLPGAVRNRGTKGELLDRAVKLRRAIEQQIGNRLPVPVLDEPAPIREVPWGEALRVHLGAARSTDADSTPGTSDNIRSYRWYHEGRLVAEGPEALVALRHDGTSSVTTHRLLLEIEDAYGAIATTTQMVLLQGLRGGTAP